jgi:hypothetical protein
MWILEMPILPVSYHGVSAQSGVLPPSTSSSITSAVAAQRSLPAAVDTANPLEQDAKFSRLTGPAGLLGTFGNTDEENFRARMNRHL